MKRRYNHRLISSNHPYTYKEISSLFKITIDTVKRWRRQGLLAVDPDSRPILVMGKELKRFVKSKMSRQRHTLKKDELYCTKCQAARHSKDQIVKLVFDVAEFSAGNKKVTIIGRCEQCGTQLFKFSSESIIRKLIKTGVLILEQGQRLKCSSDSSIKATLRR